MEFEEQPFILRECWNWQTGYFEVVVFVRVYGVQVPSFAPTDKAVDNPGRDYKKLRACKNSQWIQERFIFYGSIAYEV